MDITTQASQDQAAAKEGQVLFAGGTHLAAMFMALSTGWAAGAGGMVVGLVVWLFARDRYPHVARHAAEVFNFNFSLFVYVIAAIVFSVLTLGVGLLVAAPLAAVFAIIWILAAILGTVAGFNGRAFRYPFTMRIL